MTEPREYIVPLSEDEAFYGFKDVATPLIRCKDCKFAQLIEPHDDWWECEHDKRVLHSDGFCSWAERGKNDG